MNFLKSTLAAGLLASLGACSSEVLSTQRIQIGGASFELVTLRVGTSAGFVNRYEIYEPGDDDDPIASCTDINKCVARIEAWQKRRNTVPELLRRPADVSLPGDPPTLTSDAPKPPASEPAETSFGD